jgi:hypothetical protein
MYSDELMLMIAKFLYGEYDAEGFSFDFPARLSYIYDDLRKENEQLCDLFEDDMPEICAGYDPHGTGDDDTYGLSEFKSRVFDIYGKALPLVNPNLRKIS